ncbi:glucose 1-dehydrogenase [Marinomonas posidonica]|uniref:3-oxoacyl-(Acyl-carrier-protein) reductase n=1 Tax=Marinomonas posidonica (strain CECT 7376 / NCIMB 14433 / IVIA-Po-181) TaxID=491952 RepID=F6CX76_MARPP|nr:glucose 1-dehydrogenase [Marinomonas posidonica]AEF54429.1 3-oxoacyl-(acyl-carrier-protein) reductase [Marinomonas posidonica IVIA-Po-181]
MISLEGKTALITGGNSGIGFATAQKFQALGAQVVITGRDAEALDKASSELGVQSILADQAKMDDLNRLAVQAEVLLGKLDILFINAGITVFAPVEQTEEAIFDKMMNINFKGAFFTLQKLLPLLNDGASVIQLSSINAYTGMPNTAVYAASKAAMNAVTRTAATELAPRRIRINSVNPGPVNTPIFGKLGMSNEVLNELSTRMQNRIPLKRFGEAEDIANLVAFLASDEASFITGSEYNIDGGTNINPLLP